MSKKSLHWSVHWAPLIHHIAPARIPDPPPEPARNSGQSKPLIPLPHPRPFFIPFLIPPPAHSHSATPETRFSAAIPDLSRRQTPSEDYTGDLRPRSVYDVHIAPPPHPALVDLFFLPCLADLLCLLPVGWIDRGGRCFLLFPESFGLLVMINLVAKTRKWRGRQRVRVFGWSWSCVWSDRPYVGLTPSSR
jgi:hypothetical protein